VSDLRGRRQQDLRHGETGDEDLPEMSTATPKRRAEAAGAPRWARRRLPSSSSQKSSTRPRGEPEPGAPDRTSRAGKERERGERTGEERHRGQHPLGTRAHRHAIWSNPRSASAIEASAAAGRASAASSAQQRERERHRQQRNDGKRPGVTRFSRRRATRRSTRPTAQSRRHDHRRITSATRLYDLAEIGAREKPGAEAGLRAGRQLADDRADEARRNRDLEAGKRNAVEAASAASEIAPGAL